ncbi:hypothetical protein HK096_004835, partial [Nowakowskiella sp. JEL0078]
MPIPTNEFNDFRIVNVEVSDPQTPKKFPKFFFNRRWQQKKEESNHQGLQDVLFVPHKHYNPHIDENDKKSTEEALEDSPPDLAGMRTLAENLELKIKDLKGSIHTNMEVRTLNCINGRWIVHAHNVNSSSLAPLRTILSEEEADDVLSLGDSSQSQTFEADGVILTAPVPQSLALLQRGKSQSPLPPHIESRLSRIKYDPCLTLLLKYPSIHSSTPLLSRLIGVHVLNNVTSLSMTSTPAFAQSLSWIGFQGFKMRAEPDTMKERWKPIAKAAKVVGKFISQVDIVNALAAGSGFLPPPPPNIQTPDKSAFISREISSEKIDPAPQSENTTTQHDVSEEISQNDGECLVLQGDAVWSAKMFDSPESEIANTLESEAKDVLEVVLKSSQIPVDEAENTGNVWWRGKATEKTLKKWKYAYCVIPDDPLSDQIIDSENNVVDPPEEGFVYVDLGAPLIFAGDAFGYKLVELPKDTGLPNENGNLKNSNENSDVSTHAESAAMLAVAAAAHIPVDIKIETTEQNEIKNVVKDKLKENLQTEAHIDGSYQDILETNDKAENSENSDLSEPKEEDVAVWSGLGSEVGGYGIEAAILS